MNATVDDVWVGVDLGTQSVRAVAVDGRGTVLGAGQAPLSSRRAGTRHEQDPEQWWTSAASACRQAVADLPQEAVRAVAVDGTSGSVLLADTQGRALTPALMYDDGRAVEDVARVNEAGAAVWHRLGYQRMQPSWALPKLLWLLRAHPEAAAAGTLLHQTDVINRRLVGAPVAADLSSALKSGADLVAEDWPTDVMEALGVPERLLPPLVRPGTVLGQVGREAAEETGLPAGADVVAGMTDGCAAQLGAGVVTPGSWNSVLGTTLVLKGVTDELVHDPGGVVYSHRSPDGRWLPGGASSTGAGILTRDYADQDLSALDAAARAAGPAELVAYPLAGEGERFPFVAPGARGFEVGNPSSASARYAAALEGVAYLERLCLDYLDLLGAPTDGSVVISGGATRSAWWNQLRADVLGRPLTLTSNPEPAFGMAVLAASAGSDVRDAAGQMVRVHAVVDPQTRHAERYRASYQTLVGELESRGWLPAAAAEHARRRAS